MPALATDSRLLSMLNGMLGAEELSDPDSPEFNPALSDSLEFFRARPSLFLETIENAAPKSEQSAALIVLSNMFSAVEEEQQEKRREPLRFDESAMLLKGCETFVEDVKDFCATAELSMSNVSPFVTGWSAKRPAEKVTEATDSLLLDLRLAKDRLSALSKNIVSFCGFAARLADHTHASIELQKRLEFALQHLQLMSKEQRMQVGEALVREVECRMEFKVVQSFLAAARKKLGESELIKEFYRDWRRLWEHRKEDLADKAARMSKHAVSAINQGLVLVAVGEGRKVSGTTGKQREPAVPVLSSRTEEQIMADEKNNEFVSGKVNALTTSSSNVGLSSSDERFLHSFTAPTLAVRPQSQQSKRSTGGGSGAGIRIGVGTTTSRARARLSSALDEYEREERRKAELEALQVAKDQVNFNTCDSLRYHHGLCQDAAGLAVAGTTQSLSPLKRRTKKM